MITLRQRWLLNSTVAGTPVNGGGMGISNRLIYTAQSGTSSGVVTLQMGGSATGLFGDIPGTSTSVSTNGVNVLQFDGPLLWVRPFSSNVTGSIVVELVCDDGH